MKSKTLQICSEIIHPGETLSLALPLPKLFSCAPMFMPIKIMHGKKAGPCLLITAAMHGNELNGTQIINQLLKIPTLKQLKGTLITVPVLNVYGLINRSRYLPGGINLNRCFPGNKDGTNAERLAYHFITEIVSKADVCLDLQTGFINYSNLPQIYINATDAKAKSLAQSFNPPVISNLEFEPGSLGHYALTQNKTFLLYEAGEAMHFDDYAIKTGIKGILNMLRTLDMLPENSKRKGNSSNSFFTDNNIWLYAAASGISHSQCKLGQYVKKGQELCVIDDPFGVGEGVRITSPVDAIIVGKNNLPLIHEGEALFQLAIFSTMQHAASSLKDWKEQHAVNFEKMELN